MKKRKVKGDTTRSVTRQKKKTLRGRVRAKLSLNARGYPTGKDSIVWATYDHRQADIIRNALLTQGIACELGTAQLEGKRVYFLRVSDERGMEEAIDFVWRDKGGLRLVPDWGYPTGVMNKSFEQWLGGH
jgi:hypothetical protein